MQMWCQLEGASFRDGVFVGRSYSLLVNPR